MSLHEYDLRGRVAFVAGAGRGIGKGIAQVLASPASDYMTGQTLYLDGGPTL